MNCGSWCQVQWAMGVRLYGGHHPPTVLGSGPGAVAPATQMLISGSESAQLATAPFIYVDGRSREYVRSISACWSWRSSNQAKWETLLIWLQTPRILLL